jgi:hypothetical protein
MGEMGWSAWLVYWQILHGARAIQRLKIPWIYCCEDDSLYTEEHLSYVPPDKDKFYYNLNWWKIGKGDLAVHWDAVQVSGVCYYRELGIASIYFILGHVILFFQANSQFIWTWPKDHKILLAFVLGAPASLLFMTGITHVANATGSTYTINNVSVGLNNTIYHVTKRVIGLPMRSII